MFRWSVVTVGLVALGVFRDPGCDGVDDPNGGTNAPCTRSSDCGGGLLCLEGVCRSRDAAVDDGDASDAGASNPSSDAGAPDGG